MRLPHLIRTLVCSLLLATAVSAAQPPAAEEVQPGRVIGQPILICPPIIASSAYIPVDELLAKADSLNPVSPEGLIVRNRPVPACGQIPDSATRAYEQVEYPLQLRNYETQIRLAKAEIQMLERRVVEYRYFNKANALFTTAPEIDLALLAARERLRNLRYERSLVVRHRSLERTLETQGVIVSQEPIEAPGMNAGGLNFTPVPGQR